MKLKAKDLTGQVFGRLTAINKTTVHLGNRDRSAWECQCECGRTTVVLTEFLTAGKTKSCGCLAKELLSERQRTHGQSETKLYNVWRAMRSRCNLHTASAYMNYGGRGIHVCDEWDNSFEAFMTWAYANGYNEQLTIDRIDVNGNYEPDNCRWVDDKDQANNRRSCINIAWHGETHTLMGWSEKLGISYKKLHYRYSAGWDIDRMFEAS